MKKNLSLAGISLVAMGLFLGSCVSKKKYMEAQRTAQERYSTDSSQWASRTNTMQQNITSLEQKNTAFQSSIDSLRTSSANYQKRWESFQSAYNEQNTSTEQLHQQVHAAIDEYVEASNIESKNGKVYVNLPEKMLFASNSSQLSAKGKQALDKLAGLLATNENIEVDVITTAAYYGPGTDMGANVMDKNTSPSGNVTTDNSANRDNADVTNPDNAKVTKGTTKKPDANKKPTKDKATPDKPTTDDPSNVTADKSRANTGDSSYPGSGSVTTKRPDQDPSAKKATAKTKAPAQKNNAATVRKGTQGDKSMTYSTPKGATKSKATAKSSTNWNLNVARSTAIVRQLTQSGLPHARVVIAGQNSKGITTNEWASTNRGYQIVLSPKMDSYYQMMQGQGTTSMK